MKITVVNWLNSQAANFYLFCKGIEGVGTYSITRSKAIIRIEKKSGFIGN